ncbi:MAG: MFS transporter [Sphingomonas sp.]
MAYFDEFRSGWRPLAGALIGLGSGFSITTYITSIMAPHLLAEFGWTRSEFALVSTLSLVMVMFLPLAGRFADLMGVRRTVLIGMVTLPIVFMAYSMMSGGIGAYIGIFLVQAMICVTTTSTVYSRVVVERFVGARGLALALVASGPAITGAIGGPLLNNFVEAYGWRAGYQALAAFSVVASVVTLMLLPPRKPAATPDRSPPARKAKRDYAAISRHPAFWVMIVGLLLVNLPQVLALSQLNLVMLDNGITPAGTSIMISAFAIGVLFGRFLCGLALDRFPAHLVAAIGLGMPSIGLFLIASNLDAPMVLTVAVLLIGLSHGAEGDVVGYLVARTFGVGVYSSVLGLMTAAISTSAALGAAVLSLTLKMTGGFSVFLIIGGVSVLIGSLLFLLLKHRGGPEHALAEAPATA